MSGEERDYSPGLKDVIAGETALALVDGESGRLLYRGYPIGELVERGTYAQAAELLWTGEWPEVARLPCAFLSDGVVKALRLLPPETGAMDALRTAISVWGAEEGTTWPPSVEQARAVTAVAPSALAAFARLRDGNEPIDPDLLWIWRPVSCTSSAVNGPTKQRRTPSTLISSSLRSMASTRPHSRHGSSSAPIPTSPRRWSAPSVH